ncbi:MAG: rRNA maturation RNase YbeY [Wujia sp.]
MSVFFENDPGIIVPDTYQNIVCDVVDTALDFFSCPYDCEVNVVFTDNVGIREINREYREIDAPTDVLSFPMIEYEQPAHFDGLEQHPEDYFNQDSGELMLGDIILNIDRIASQSEEYGHTKRREVAFLTAHSMLHLFGYDHIDDDERREMETLQEQILSKKGYTRENEEE